MRGAAIRAIRLQYEKDRLLIEQRAQIEQQNESERRRHEWRMMLADKGLFALLVGLALGMATFCGDVVVERYKNDAALTQARAQTIRNTTNEVWARLVACEESVDELGDAVRTQRWHKGFGLFRDETARDQKNVNDADAKTTQTFSELWEALRSQELTLGPDMHGIFFRAMQDIMVIRYVYETEATDGHEPVKVDDDMIEAEHRDLTKLEQFLSSVMNQP